MPVFWPIFRKPGTGLEAGRPTQAYTLLEIIVVLALIALLGSIFLISATAVFRTQEDQTVETILQKAIMESRLLAVREGIESRLRYDRESGFLSLEGAGSGLTFGPLLEDERPLDFRFLTKRATRELVLIRGEVIDTRETPYVRFFPDGASEPFLVEWVFRGQNVRQEFDLWTEALIPAAP